MTYAKLGLALLQFLNWLGRWFDSRKDIELGRSREREANAKADTDLRTRIDGVSSDGVSDSEAFGFTGNNLPRSPTGRRSKRPD